MTKSNFVDIIRSARFITITPVGKADSGNETRKDYDWQLHRESENDRVKWDDSAQNSSRVGDLFGFVFGSGSNSPGAIEIRRIEGILTNPAARDRTWNNPAHRNRRVLVLSEVLCETTWVLFRETVGREPWGHRADGTSRSAPCKGTQRWNI